MLPRGAFKLSTIPQCSRLLAIASKTPRTSSLHLTAINQIPKKQKLNDSKPTSSRWFTAISLPQSIAMFTGNTALVTKNDRTMQRVWEKRKQKLFRATSGILEKFKTKKMNFETADIYIRKAGSFDDSEDNGQREVHIALRGIAHTVVVLKSKSVEGNESYAYLLDRVVEGIRLTELQINDQTLQIEKCNKFKPEEMVKLSTFDNINLSSVCIAEWINKESQNKYNVFTNSCVQFSFYFYQQFLFGLKAKQIINSWM